MATKVCQLEVYSDSTVVIKDGIGWTPNDSNESCQFERDCTSPGTFLPGDPESDPQLCQSGWFRRHSAVQSAVA